MPKDAKSCLPWYSKRSMWVLGLGGGVLAGVERLGEPVGDRRHGRAGGEEGGDALLLELVDVGAGDDAAAEDEDVVEAAGLELLEHPGEQRHVGAGEEAQTDAVGVLLEGGLGDLLGRLAEAGVDDLEAGVPEGTRDDLGAPVVTVEADLGDDDAIAPVHGGDH